MIEKWYWSYPPPKDEPTDFPAKSDGAGKWTTKQPINNNNKKQRKMQLDEHYYYNIDKQSFELCLYIRRLCSTFPFWIGTQKPQISPHFDYTVYI
jgi:hypothetical protein